MIDWSNKKLNVWYAVALVSQILLILVAPILTIVISYGIKDKISMNLMGVILLGIFVFFFLKKFKKVIDNMKLSTKKNVIQMLFKLLFVGASIFILYELKTNFNVAFNVICICLSFITLSIILDGLFFKKIEEVYYYNKLATEKINTERRVGFNR